ncbi:DNA recombination protein RmuC [Demequina muriae]|uniref:DNA recombination protein RmuC n=1 Tax=Demequina muriae TaxID=3051664 RepID=A0ABT8GFH1_9MICO|nr:DNA recombination protein RmuC [Demequina sp. EGI L300058]MDN4480021.1 DNA recombination protein RmuC [Demequina sp. EGI L300058]
MVELLIAASALLAGLAAGYLLATRRSAKVETRAAIAHERVAMLEQQAQRQADAWVQREAELTAAHERYVAQVRGDQETMRQQFAALSQQTLKASQESLLEVARERFARERQAGEAELAKREQAVRQLVEPMAKALDVVQRQTAEADKARASGHAQLSEQVRQMLAASDKLDKRTTDFINTLRRSDVRGNWGEVQLRRVVELAGMVEHVDFTEQDSVRDGEGRLQRPDLTVKLAGGRSIVVDSKVALSALIEAFETDDEDVRADRLRAHARHIRKHVDDLAAKKYWEQFPSAPEFVVMFVPSEAFYQSALEQDGDLQEYAFGKRVFIATPTTLVAMLRTVAHAWKEDALAKNAQDVLSTGKELYDRLSTMGEHLAKVGRAIEGASRAYNQTVASLESRVLVSARKFRDMQQIDAPLPDVDQVATEPRELTAPELRTSENPDRA